MKCTECYYAEPRYNQDGVQIGIDCSKDNMRFVEIEIAQVMGCGAWAEKD